MTTLRKLQFFALALMLSVLILTSALTGEASKPKTWVCYPVNEQSTILAPNAIIQKTVIERCELASE